MKLCKILGLSVKLKNDESNFLPISGKKRFLNVTKVKRDRHGRSPNCTCSDQGAMKHL